MIEVLRLSHRIPRDARLTTHVILVARAFGAEKVYYSGNKDKELENTIKKVVENFGGNFDIEYVKDPLSFVKGYNGLKIHLTMYGQDYKEKLKEIKKNKNILLIVGSEKVPIEFYKESDFNISVGNTPHSEVAALSILIYELKNHQLPKFKNQKLKIIPGQKGINL